MEIEELKDIVVSAVALALAFGIAFSGGVGGLTNIFSLINSFLIALITVSISFIFHELGHRTLARKYGYFAAYKMWPNGLLLALLFSLFGFVFAAPGAVVIHPRIDLYGNIQRISRKKYGIISLAGPVTNLVLAFIFALLAYLPIDLLANIFSFGVYINIWLALFNLLPLPPLDGSKIFVWNKKIWAVLFTIAIILFVII